MFFPSLPQLTEQELAEVIANNKEIEAIRNKPQERITHGGDKDIYINSNLWKVRGIGKGFIIVIRNGRGERYRLEELKDDGYYNDIPCYKTY